MFTVSYLDGRLGASAGLLPTFTFDDLDAALTKYTELVNEARDAVIIDGTASRSCPTMRRSSSRSMTSTPASAATTR